MSASGAGTGPGCTLRAAQCDRNAISPGVVLRCLQDGFRARVTATTGKQHFFPAAVDIDLDEINRVALEVDLAAIC